MFSFDDTPASYSSFGADGAVFDAAAEPVYRGMSSFAGGDIDAGVCSAGVYDSGVSGVFNLDQPVYRGCGDVAPMMPSLSPLSSPSSSGVFNAGDALAPSWGGCGGDKSSGTFLGLRNNTSAAAAVDAGAALYDAALHFVPPPLFDEPPSLPAAPFVLRAAHVRFEEDAQAGSNGSPSSIMDVVHAELTRLGADVESPAPAGTIDHKPFKRSGVVYVEQAGLHFKVKMYRVQGGALVCEFTKKRGDSFLWSHFFRHFKANIAIKAADWAEHASGNGNGNGQGNANGSKRGDSIDSSSSSSSSSSSNNNNNNSVQNRPFASATSFSPSSSSSPAFPATATSLATFASASAFTSALPSPMLTVDDGMETDEADKAVNGNSDGDDKVEDEALQAVTAVRDLASMMSRRDTTAEEQAAALAILTSVCQKQAQKRDSRGRPRAASASGWAAAGRTLRAGTVAALLEVEHVAALERILREQRCPDTSRCAAALVGSIATLAGCLVGRDEEEEGKGGRGKGGRAASGGGHHTLLKLVPALLSILERTDFSPSFFMLQCRRDVAAAVGAISLLGTQCTFPSPALSIVVNAAREGAGEAASTARCEDVDTSRRGYHGGTPTRSLPFETNQLTTSPSPPPLSPRPFPLLPLSSQRGPPVRRTRTHAQLHEVASRGGWLETRRPDALNLRRNLAVVDGGVKSVNNKAANKADKAVLVQLVVILLPSKRRSYMRLPAGECTSNKLSQLFPFWLKSTSVHTETLHTYMNKTTNETMKKQRWSATPLLLFLGHLCTGPLLCELHKNYVPTF